MRAHLQQFLAAVAHVLADADRQLTPETAGELAEWIAWVGEAHADDVREALAGLAPQDADCLQRAAAHGRGGVGVAQ